MAALISASTVGILIAWWREGIGGLILVVCGLSHGVFAYFAAGHNKALAVLISCVPFLLVGMLFLLIWRRMSFRT